MSEEIVNEEVDTISTVTVTPEEATSEAVETESTTEEETE